MRLIMSLNYRCLSASIPSMLQSRLGCPTHTHRHTHAQVCSVRRSACVSEQGEQGIVKIWLFSPEACVEFAFLLLLLYSRGLLIRAVAVGFGSAWGGGRGAADLRAFLRRWHQNMRPLTPRLAAAVCSHNPACWLTDPLPINTSEPPKAPGSGRARGCSSVMKTHCVRVYMRGRSVRA